MAVKEILSVTTGLGGHSRNVPSRHPEITSTEHPTREDISAILASVQVSAAKVITVIVWDPGQWLH